MGLKICLVLILCNQFLAHAKTINEKPLHLRPVRNLSPTVTATTPAEPTIKSGIRIAVICSNRLYTKYVRENPKLSSISLTSQEVDEFHSNMFDTLSKHYYRGFNSIYLLRHKSYPAVKVFLENYNFLSPSGELQLEKCRSIPTDDDDIDNRVYFDAYVWGLKPVTQPNIRIFT